ncbi:MAG: hypothetical protein U0Q18_29470 [Bryobacteraceae bacterium]
MNGQRNRLLYWTPRVLCVLFIGFVSMFALDVFDEAHGFWQTVTALAMHLIPAFVMIGALIVAWRWEWIGTAMFSICGVFFLYIVRGPLWVKSMFVVPCLVTAGLFLLDWREKRARHSHTIDRA